MSKTRCPITRETFTNTVIPAGPTRFAFDATPREFSTGSFGWGHSGKETITIDGKPVTVQVSLNITIVGSKEVPK